MTEDELNGRYWVAVKVVRYDEHEGCGIVKPEFWDHSREAVERHIEQRKDPSLIFHPVSWGMEPNLGNEFGGEVRVLKSHEEMSPRLKAAVDYAYEVDLKSKSFFPGDDQERPLSREEWESRDLKAEGPKKDNVVSMEEYRRRHGLGPKL
jgi:hypothetical protein